MMRKYQKLDGCRYIRVQVNFAVFVEISEHGVFDVKPHI